MWGFHVLWPVVPVGVAKQLGRDPITPHLLRQVKEVWDVNAADPDYIMLWAACCLAFFAFLRVGELTIPNTWSMSGFHVSSLLHTLVVLKLSFLDCESCYFY